MSGAKHIIFDWNCTLLDDFTALHDCMNVIMERAGRPAISADFFRAHYEVPFESLYRNLGFSAAEIAHMMTMDRDVFHNSYEPMADRASLRPGAAEILGHAKQHGVTTLILSNHIVAPIRNQLRRLEVEHFFDEVLAYESREAQFRDMTKGEKLRRFRAARDSQAPAIIIGDSVEEIEIAKEQGLIGVGITGGCTTEARLRAAQPDYIIHSLHELQPILRERGFTA